MSKWIDKKKFEDFKKERENDIDNGNNNIEYARIYPNPKKGSQNKPKQYHVRLLPDPDGNFYKKIYFHMFQSGDNWVYLTCPKTHDMDTYCPWCHASQILYKGSSNDKKLGYRYRRQEKYVTNIFVVRDPRDVDENDPDKKLTGKTFLYPFPKTIEQLIRKEITDVENGWGYDIFDPENGYNLIISIGSKKPDKDGKVWPDYSLTSFSRKPTPIAKTEEEIEKIMETRQSIEEYVNNSMLDAESTKKMLKKEMLYDDVADSFEKHYDVSSDDSTKDGDDVQENDELPWDDEDKNNDAENVKNDSNDSIEETVNDVDIDDDVDDDDLLAELENL